MAGRRKAFACLDLMTVVAGSVRLPLMATTGPT